MSLLLEKSSDWKERPMKNKDLMSSLKEEIINFILNNRKAAKLNEWLQNLKLS